MKIAILISGEYRTFGMCRPTMKFLDDPRADIYFSTWDKTVYKVPIIGLYREELITEDKIKNDLGKDAVILIEPHGSVIEKRYNVNMIHRWKRGFDLIKNSGIEYDYVLVMRPDLYMRADTHRSFDFAENIKDTLASAWYNPITRPEFLNDVIFMSSFKKIKDLFEALTSCDWSCSRNDDWHTWWYDFNVIHFQTIRKFSELDSSVFCRVWANEQNSFEEIDQIQQDWFDLSILQLMDTAGRHQIIDTWPADLIEKAELKWATNLYAKY